MGSGDGRGWHSTRNEACGAFRSSSKLQSIITTTNIKLPDATIRLPARRFQFMSENIRQRAEDHYYAALDLVAEGEAERAVEEYQKSLEADPTFTEAMHGLARVLQNLDRLDEAIAVANKIAELDPDDVLAHTSLSVLYQKKGMIPEAEAEGNKARVLGWKQQLKKSGR